MDEVSRSIAESGYIGWVAWIDGAPVFERVPVNFSLVQTTSTAVDKPVRRQSRNTVDWKELEHPKISRLEIYGFHEHYTQQPLFRMDRAPGAEEVRYACMTMQGIAFGPGIVGQARTGIAGWKVGWYNPKRKEFDLWQITRDERIRLNPHGNPDRLSEDGPACKGHPCWPRPHGFGIAPWVFGLTDEQVPSPPALQ